MNNTSPDFVDSIAALAAKSTPETCIGGVPGAIIPEKYKLVEFPERAPRPLRIHGTTTLHTAEAFLSFYNRFATDQSVILCNKAKGMFQAVFDYHHQDGTPDWCDHRALYSCPFSLPWITWTGSSGKWMNQEEFAEFVERNLPDIIDPVGAEMLEIVLSLQARSEASFKRAVRLDNGQVQFQYHEEISGSAGRDGQLTIPTSFKLGIQVLQGGAYYTVEALFRYRITTGKLTLSYELLRHDRVFDSALNDIYQMVDESMTVGTLYEGLV